MKTSAALWQLAPQLANHQLVRRSQSLTEEGRLTGLKQQKTDVFLLVYNDNAMNVELPRESKNRNTKR